MARSPQFLASDQAHRQWGDEAVSTFHHYFENNGHDFEISVNKMLSEVPTVKAKYDECLRLVDELAETLSDGEYLFTTATAGRGAISKEESENWYLAMAGYSFWIKGTITVVNNISNISTQFKIWDRYDWDPGAKIPIDTSPGLAKEFSSLGATDFSITSGLQARALH